MQHTDVRGGLRLSSRIECTALRVPDELDDLAALMATLRRQERRYRDASTHEVMAAIRRGEVRHTQLLGRTGGENKLVRGFYSDFFARLMGRSVTPGVNQTLFIEKFAVGLNFAATTFNQTQLGSELYRATPTEFYDDTVSTFSATTYIQKSQANPTGNTTVSSATSTVLTVASGTGFIVGGRAQVETGSTTYKFTISAINGGNQLTCTNITGGSLTGAGAFPAGDIPVSPNPVKALHSEAGCFIGGGATGDPNTGTMMNRRPIEQLKDSSISLLYDFVLACESLD